MTKPKTTGKIKPHGTGKKKIEIKFIENKSYRMTTFSKRRKGLFKKADEFRAKTGSKVAILVKSPAGRPYQFGDIDFVKEALNSDPSLQKNDNINPPEEEEEDGSLAGKPDWYGDMNARDSALKYDLSLPKNNRINPPEEKEEEDRSRAGKPDWYGDMNVSDSALKCDLSLRINPPEEKEEEDRSRAGKPDWYGDRDIGDSALKYDSRLRKNNSINPPEEKNEDSSRSRARTGGSKVGLKQWLDDLDLDKCDNLEGLCSLKKQLEEIEKMVLTKELSTWKLSLCNSPLEILICQ